MAKEVDFFKMCLYTNLLKNYFFINNIIVIKNNGIFFVLLIMELIKLAIKSPKIIKIYNRDLT